MDPFHANLLLAQCQRLASPPRPFDCALRVLASDGPGADAKEHFLFAHCQVLSAHSVPLRAQLEEHQSEPVPAARLLLEGPAEAQALAAAGALGPELREVKLDLGGLDNGLEAVRQFLAFLYGEQPSGQGAVPEQLLFLSKLLAVPDLELVARSILLGRLLNQPSIVPVANADVGTIASSSTSTPSDVSLPLYAAYIQLQALLGQPAVLPQVPMPSAASFPFGQPASSFPQQQQPFARHPSSDSPTEPLAQPLMSSVDRRESGSSGSSLLSAGGGDFGGAHPQEQLVPSNDKEGWCRNKKYIQIVKKGYRCLLCNKVYGRYNSVSYHVTIYHRNPPIRCEEQGCQFTTREARYIHFHKYYRHQIALPESIDLASRKCPLHGCKHVSKSPAMLDKHVQRHVADCLKDGLHQCQMAAVDGQQCQFTANSHELMYAHLLANHANAAVGRPLKDEECPIGAERKRSDGAILGGARPRLVSASAPNTPPTPANARFHCDDCAFRGRTLSALEQHRAQKHSPNGGQPSGIQLGGSLPGSVLAPASALNGLFGGLFPAFASLPGSPLSPNASNGGGLFQAVPAPFEQQQSAQQLLAQLFAAQKLASALFTPAGSNSQQQQLAAHENVGNVSASTAENDAAAVTGNNEPKMF